MPQPSQRVLWGVLALLTAGFLYTIADAFVEPHIVETGDPAPSFSVTTDSGRKLSRADFGGKLLVLNFWASWCPPCRKEWPALNEMQRQLQNEGVVVLALSVEKDEQQYRAFLRQNPAVFQTGRDLDSTLSATYGTYKIPETYIIDREGKVVAKYISDQDWTSPEIMSTLRRYL